MLIGIKGHWHGANKPQDLSCPSCQTLGTTTLNAFTMYVQVFGVPFLPVRKKVLSHCTSCGTSLKPPYASPSFELQAQRMLEEAKTPPRTYVGLLLILFLSLGAQYGMKWFKSRSIKLLAQPQIADVYLLQTDKHVYTTMKLMGISGDSLYFHHNRFQSDKESGISKILNDSCYAHTLFPYHKQHLDSMRNGEVIIRVKRKAIE